MKTLRFLLIAGLVAITVSGFSKADEDNNLFKSDQKVIYLDFEEIYLVPGLVEVMHRRLDGSFLLDEEQTIYTVDVDYLHTIFRITGTYEQWVSFFWPKWLNIAPKYSQQPIK
jgi:hypothetical protein